MLNKKILLLLLCSIFLIGCGKTEEDINSSSVSNNIITNDTSYTISEKNQQYDDFKDLNISNTKDLSSLTKEEFLDLSIEDIKKIIAVNTEDYKQTYHITKEELTDSDWENLKFILYYQMYGSEGLEYYFGSNLDQNLLEKIQLVMPRDEIIKNYELTEEEANYLLPTSEYILSLTNEEFLNWLKNASEYYDSIYTINYDQLSDEILQETKENYASSLKEIEDKQLELQNIIEQNNF